MNDLPAPRAVSRPWPRYAAAVAAVVASFAALGLLILSRYPLRHYAYPVGWDSAFYVWRSAAVTVDGLARIGTVRAGSPLLVGVLMRVTGQNGFTMVAVAMAVGAAIVALGAGAMSRAALGVSAGWMVAIGVLSWVAFGHIGMIPGGHFDNVLNAAFVISAFGAAVSFAGDRKGAVAMAVLFAAGALAEWPFSVLAAAIFLLGLVLFAWPALRALGEPQSEVFRVVRPLVLALGASAVFAALAVLARPSGRLLHHFGQQGRAVIKERFMQRLRDPSRWYAIPPAVLGGFLAARIPLSPRRNPARRLFLALLVAWVVVTFLTSVAQLLDVPVAGGRLLNYLFAIPLLAGLFFWALARALASRWGPRGMALGALIAVAAAVGFGSMGWRWQIDHPPSIGPAAVRQAAAAGEYAAAAHPRGEVVFVQQARRHTWEELQASLPPDVVPRAKQFSGTPADLQSGTFESQLGAAGGQAIAFVLKAYNRAGYREALGSGRWSEVASGVLVLPATVAAAPSGAVPPRGNFGVWALTWIVAAVALLLAGVGSGWAVALLPSDPLIRVSLSPGLGAATVALAAVIWDRVGLGFSTVQAWCLVLLTAAAGWAVAVLVWRKAGRSTPSPDDASDTTPLMSDS